MRNPSLFLLIIVGFLISYCSPKVVQQTSIEVYKEDLSTIRPPIDSLTEELSDELIKAPYVEPTHHHTARINSLMDSIAIDNAKKKFRYYTIQVYVGNSREQANEVRSKVYSVIPEETPKLEYSQPNYRVKVGTFESRLEANKTFTILKNSFPGAVLVSEMSYLK